MNRREGREARSFLLRCYVPRNCVVRGDEDSLGDSQVIIATTSCLTKVSRVTSADGILFVGGFPVVLVVREYKAGLFPSLFLSLSSRFVLSFSITMGVVEYCANLAAIRVFSGCGSSNYGFRINVFLCGTKTFATRLRNGQNRVCEYFYRCFPTGVLTSYGRGVIGVFVRGDIVFHASTICCDRVPKVGAFNSGNFGRPTNIEEMNA